MAGTLTVQNIEGPSSGANANTVLIPSGQELHAPGHVIQYQQRHYDCAGFSSTTASFIDFTNVYVDITPKFSNSLIRFKTQCIGRNATTAGYAQFRIVDSNNSDTRFNVNSVAESGFYQGTAWDTAIIVATATANTTSTMRLQLQVYTYTGTTNTFDWSSGDSRHIEAWEIAA